MIDVAQLRCFVAVGEDAHFGRAARRLNMTQPPLSRQIRILEQRLGLALFERSTRQVRLTAAGAALLPEARAVLNQLAHLTASAGQLASGHAGRVRLGFTSGAAYALVPRIVSAASRVLPGVQLELQELPTADQLDMLASGTLDLAIVRPIAPPIAGRERLTLRCVARERLLLAVADSHPLRRVARPIVARDLRDQAFLLYTPLDNAYFHALVQGIMDRTGLMPPRVQHVRAIHTILPLVSAGVGLALVPESARQLRVPGVALRTLAAELAGTADLYLASHRDNSNPAVATLLARVFAKLEAAARATSGSPG
jgi:DNA-binding transcriptional LysR family regulator